MKNKHTRNFQLQIDQVEGRTIRGYAAKWNVLSQLLGDFVEYIEPGAFANVPDGDIRLLHNHNSDFVLARTTNGSLRLWQDDIGLAFEAVLSETSIGNDVLQMVREGLVTGMSFGFTILQNAWKQGEAGQPRVHILRKILIDEVSTCIFPAYLDSEVHARSEEEATAYIDSLCINTQQIDGADIADQKDSEETQIDTQVEASRRAFEYAQLRLKVLELQ